MAARSKGETPNGFSVVGIGASAGGLEATSELLSRLSADVRLAIVVVQHLDPTHPSSLAELLSRACSLPVLEATEAAELEAGTVYVIPPNVGISVVGSVLHLTERDAAERVPRVIDRFFNSLAELHGDRAIGVVLSGTGSDGTLGLQAIRAAGGITLAQDETATHTGMPSSAIAAGCVDVVLAPWEMAEELMRIARHPRHEGPGRYEGWTRPISTESESLVQLFALVREAWGVDFTHYK